MLGEGPEQQEAHSVPAVSRGTLLESAKVGDVPCTFQTVYGLAPSGVLAPSHRNDH